VAAEQWHPAQRGEWDAKGHWVLRIPYSDDRELLMDILRHTPEVEVLAPVGLRERVLEKMQEGLVRWGAVS
jgi:predicted DNA-binding transcriptional regulator YafY